MRLLSYLFLLSLACGLALAAKVPAGTDEFVGPFPSWANVKTDYGAVGDGKADDTAALQKALDTFGAKSPVLYLPAGTYRITKGLEKTSGLYLSIVGEDPARTIIKWDGGDDGVMLLCNGMTYSKIGRITWDGGGKPVTGVWHRWDGIVSNAASGLEHMDEVFKNLAFGIRAGKPHFMDAECPVIRCQFLRCSQAGVSIESFNALDWWVWYSRFEDCKVGVTNAAEGVYGGGSFHVYESLFQRSTEADVKIGHTLYFGIRNNTSIGSKAFFVGIRPHFSAGAWTPDDTWGANLALQGNIILDPQDETPIRIADSCSLFLLDNVIRGRVGVTAPVAKITAPGAPSIVAVGNTVTVAKPYETTGTITDVDTKIVVPKAIPTKLPMLPAMAPCVTRKIFEVPAKADGEAIQALINQAAKAGEHAVVHIPFGQYKLAKTLVIPTNTDLQIIGDGQPSQLICADPVGVRVLGPTQAVLSDFQIFGMNAAKDSVVLRIEGVDQPGGRVYGDQLWAYARCCGILARDLTKTMVELRGTQPGGGDQENATICADHSTMTLFGAATSGNFCTYDVRNGGVLLVRDTWFEGGAEQWANLRGSGRFTMDGGKVACMPQVATEKPTLLVDNLQGKVTLVCFLFTANDWWAVNGNTSDTKLLMLSGMTNGLKRRYEINNPAAEFGILGNRYFDNANPRGGTAVEADAGTRTPEFLREMLADDRALRPSLPNPKRGVSCLRMHRLLVQTNTGSAIEITK